MNRFDPIEGQDVPAEARPQFLDEECSHLKYSAEGAMEHYKNKVYYRQRKGGEDWFPGRVSPAYRNNYDRIQWNK